MREVILIVKLNRLDEVTALLGAERSDRLMAELREVVRAACRDSDATWRNPDDTCLAALLVEDAQSGIALAERIRHQVADHVFDAGDGVQLGITCSIGFASYRVPDVDPDLDLWRRAIDLARRALESAESGGDSDWVGFVAPDTGEGPPEGFRDVLEHPRIVVRHDFVAAHRSHFDLDLLLLAERMDGDTGDQPHR